MSDEMPEALHHSLIKDGYTHLRGFLYKRDGKYYRMRKTAGVWHLREVWMSVVIDEMHQINKFAGAAE